MLQTWITESLLARYNYRHPEVTQCAVCAVASRFLPRPQADSNWCCPFKGFLLKWELSQVKRGLPGAAYLIAKGRLHAPQRLHRAIY